MRSFMAVFWFLISVVLAVATNAAETPRTYRVHDLGAHVSSGQVPLPPSALPGIGDLGGGSTIVWVTNSVGEATGTSVAITGDSHAFRFEPGTGLIDLGTLGGYHSTGLGLDVAGHVVGTAQTANRSEHAFVWSPNFGLRDLNELIPVNAGWVLISSDEIDPDGSIRGQGELSGELHRYLLTPVVGPDLTPPVARVNVADITNLLYSALLFSVDFWDDSGVRITSFPTNSIRVTGPNGFDQPAVWQRSTASGDGRNVHAEYYVLSPSGVWNGTNNGIYSVAVEPVGVSDIVGNQMSGGEAGTFRVVTETQPLVSLFPLTGLVSGQTNTYSLSAIASFPHSTNDVFQFVVRWENDGSPGEIFTGPSGLVVSHRYDGLGLKPILLSATDSHGVNSETKLVTVQIGEPASEQVWSFGASLTGGRNHPVGLNVQGTLVVAGGFPVKSTVGTVSSLAPGATTWADEKRLPSAATGFGAGVDSLGRMVFFGGLNPGAALPTTAGYVYLRSSGVTAIAPKHFAVHRFAFAADAQHRLYAIGGATSASASDPGSVGVERYDGTANQWTVLAPLPQPRIEAVAAVDHAGHLLVIGGIDPATRIPSNSVWSYDIAANSWSQRGDLGPGIPTLLGWSAVTGADGQIYLIGGESPGISGAATGACSVYDFNSDQWLAGPSLKSARSYFGAVLGNDGVIQVIGGNSLAVGGNNGLSSIEGLATLAARPPLIQTSPGDSVLAGQRFQYQMRASGNPRPTYALVQAPVGMTLDPVHGDLSWTPDLSVRGPQSVVLRAENSAAALDQRFSILVRSPDLTPPLAPTNLFVYARTATNIWFSWAATTDDVGVDHYALWRFIRGSRSSHWGPVVDGITNRSVIYPIVGGGTFAVVAVDAAGNLSPRSATLVASSVPIPAITHVGTNEPAALIQGNGFLYTLAATAPPAVGFVEFQGPPGMLFSPTSGPDTNRIYLVVQWMPTLAQVGTNRFTITATNLNATGSATFQVVVLPPTTDVVPPTPVGVFVADSVTSDSCGLHWTPAGDNIGIGSYSLRAIHFGAIGQSNHVVTLSISGSETNAVLAGLLPMAAYTVTIVPTDLAGNVGLPVSILVTTLTGPLAPVGQAVFVPSATPGMLELQWQGGGEGWFGTLEFTDSLVTPQWTPVPPADQWPAAATRLSIAISDQLPGRYYRVRPAN